ncbi:MAG: phosphatase PAP2 family protein [Planctomycetes bacterium]|nr:phosphatase PAP2 family protein [Planctomycetota bacterium]
MSMIESRPTPVPRPLTWALPILFLIATVASLAFDLPVATLAKRDHHPRWMQEILENAETFGHGIGVTMIVIAVLALDPSRRRSCPQLLAGSLGAGLIANLLKLLVIRHRPRDIAVLPDSVFETFGGLWSKSGGNAAQSFPSAHTATAVGLAVMLSAYYPRGRWYFVTMATLVGIQRLECSAHFPSDVLAGATVGWCIAAACLLSTASRDHQPVNSLPTLRAR